MLQCVCVPHKYNGVFYKYSSHFIYSSGPRHPRRFRRVAMVNNAAVNTGGQVYLRVSVSLCSDVNPAVGALGQLVLQCLIV